MKIFKSTISKKYLIGLMSFFTLVLILVNSDIFQSSLQVEKLSLFCYALIFTIINCVYHFFPYFLCSFILLGVGIKFKFKARAFYPYASLVLTSLAVCVLKYGL